MIILLICEQLDGKNGWSRYSGDLTWALRQSTHTVKTLTCEDGIPKPLSLLTRPFLGWFLAQKIRKAAQDVDIIHITVEPYAIAVPFLPKHLQQKVVLTIHGSYGIRPLKMWQSALLAKSYVRAIPKFITVSQYTKQAVAKEIQDTRVEQRMTVITNGIRIPEILPEKEAHEGKNILHVGGVKPIKGVLELIEGFALYANNHADCTLSIVGKLPANDVYKEKVQKRITELELTEKVHLRGMVSEKELATAYARSDVFLLPNMTEPNTFEGFGLVFLEANLYGIPCIGSAKSGSAEAIWNGKTGFLIEPKNAEDIAQKIHMVLDEKKINSEDCIAWAKEHDILQVTKKVERVYQQ